MTEQELYAEYQRQDAECKRLDQELVALCDLRKETTERLEQAGRKVSAVWSMLMEIHGWGWDPEKKVLNPPQKTRNEMRADNGLPPLEAEIEVILDPTHAPKAA